MKSYLALCEDGNDVEGCCQTNRNLSPIGAAIAKSGSV